VQINVGAHFFQITSYSRTYLCSDWSSFVSLKTKLDFSCQLCSAIRHLATFHYAAEKSLGSNFVRICGVSWPLLCVRWQTRCPRASTRRWTGFRLDRTLLEPAKMAFAETVRMCRFCRAKNTLLIDIYRESAAGHPIEMMKNCLSNFEVCAERNFS